MKAGSDPRTSTSAKTAHSYIFQMKTKKPSALSTSRRARGQVRQSRRAAEGVKVTPDGKFVWITSERRAASLCSTGFGKITKSFKVGHAALSRVHADVPKHMSTPKMMLLSYWLTQ